MSDSSPKLQERNRVRVTRTPGRYAVLLNALAKGWTGSLHHEIQRFVSSSDLYLTDDFRQAERTVDRLLTDDYDAIFTGGGDGTIVYLVNAIEERIRAGQIDREDAPPVGVLRMGTGNAIASYVGAGPVTDDLRALRAGAPLVTYSVDFIEGGDRLFPFAGFGWDADILNDYEGLKDAVRDTALENYATGLGGYVASVFGRTIPRVLQTDPVRMKVTNRGERALRVDFDGNVLEEYEEGDVLFEGLARVVGTASIPYWGFKIRMFPHATEYPGMAQVRCYHGSVGWIVSHLPRFWKGEFPEDDIDDFVYSHVEVEVQGRALPYQVAGDAAGFERVVDWKIGEHPVTLAVPMRSK
jgi:diacylglycerol kinase family enzyme